MIRLFNRPIGLAALTLRVAIFSLALGAPVLALPSVSGGQGVVIEAPTAKSNGIGLVLLMSLQRA